QRLRANTPITLIVLFPALWSLTEWMRSWILSGFPWLSVGYSQVPSSPFAGYAPVLGVYGVSLFVAAVAGAAASVIVGLFKRRPEAKSRRRVYGLISGVFVFGVIIITGTALKSHQ